MATSEQAFVDEFNYDISDLLSEKNINDFYLTPKSKTPNGIYENIFFIRVTYILFVIIFVSEPKKISTPNLKKRTQIGRSVKPRYLSVSHLDKRPRLYKNHNRVRRSTTSKIEDRAENVFTAPAYNSVREPLIDTSVFTSPQMNQNSPAHLNETIDTGCNTINDVQSHLEYVPAPIHETSGQQVQEEYVPLSIPSDEMPYLSNLNESYLANYNILLETEPNACDMASYNAVSPVPSYNAVSPVPSCNVSSIAPSPPPVEHEPQLSDNDIHVCIFVIFYFVIYYNITSYLFTVE